MSIRALARAGLVAWACLVTSGCPAESESPADEQALVAGAPADSVAAEHSAGGGDGPAEATPSEVPDLRTRKTGVDWPVFLGPRGDGSSPETGILTEWPDGGPPLRWQRELGTSYGAVAVSRGRLFLFERHGDQCRLTAVKSETGDELWRFEYPTDYVDLYGYDDGPRSAPVVDEDRVYIFGAGGMLHCLSVVDGSVVWKKDTSKDYSVVQNFFGVGSSPLVEGELLIVQIGGSDPEGPDDIHSGSVRGLDSGIVAFDKRTGEERYRITDELASYASPVTVTIEGRRWCFVLARGGLVGFDPATGKVDFRFPWRARSLQSVNASNPVVVGDRVFISEAYGVGGALLAVKPGAHEVIWEDEDRRDLALAAHWMTPIHVEGHLYGSSGRHSEPAELRCLELETGEVKWSQPGLRRASLLLVEGHFICLSETGELRLLKVSPKGYEVLAETKKLVKSPAWAAPILSHGLLYIRGKDRLLCLELIPE